MSVVAEGLQRLWQRAGAAARREGPTSPATAATGGSSSQEPVVVWQAANPMEAQIVRGRLVSAGIPAIVRGEAMGRIYGFVYGGLAQRDVLVPGPLAEAAAALLAEEVRWAEEDEEEGGE